jgi:hypothetical protein
MPSRILCAVVLAFLVLQGRAAEPRDALLGIWRGTSLCTGARPACRDEVVVMHVTAAEKADVVTVAMNKIVEGQELEMGTIDFTVDPAKQRMVGEFDNGRVASRWTFDWTKSEMKGTAVQLPSGTVIRNIALHR